jgi:hypothetical protein
VLLPRVIAMTIAVIVTMFHATLGNIGMHGMAVPTISMQLVASMKTGVTAALPMCYDISYCVLTRNHTDITWINYKTIIILTLAYGHITVKV